jgi:hypothetical protein
VIADTIKWQTLTYAAARTKVLATQTVPAGASIGRAPSVRKALGNA